jgi:DNA cross-link repair 1B protein
MYLFEGYFGRIFHTGDFRFNERMLEDNLYLFPEELRNKEKKGCALKVDEMIFDNTYCNPYFDFPTAEKVFEKMVEIIEKNKGKRVLIAMGALGKEEICVKLSRKF